jgi:hypothetical protein
MQLKTSLGSLCFLACVMAVGCASPPVQATGEALYLDSSEHNEYRVLRQGDEAIREVDYYRIAGRDGLVREIEAVQRPVSRIKKGSAVLVLAGFTAAGSSYFLSERRSLGVLETRTKQYIAFGGIAAIVVGGLVWYLIDDSVLSRHYMLHGPDLATEVGDEYNARLGVKPPTKEVVTETR